MTVLCVRPDDLDQGWRHLWI